MLGISLNQLVQNAIEKELKEVEDIKS